MLSTWLTKETVIFVSQVENWEEAIKMASIPLLENEKIKETYVETMIENVKKFGPYIVLMPHVAMPHARPEDGVNKTAISLLITEKSVFFNEQKSANLFFVLAAEDATNHLLLLTAISEFLSDEKKVDALRSAKQYEDIKQLL